MLDGLGHDRPCDRLEGRRWLGLSGEDGYNGPVTRCLTAASRITRADRIGRPEPVRKEDQSHI
jgi:hypothetical protein